MMPRYFFEKHAFYNAYSEKRASKEKNEEKNM